MVQRSLSGNAVGPLAAGEEFVPAGSWWAIGHVPSAIGLPSSAQLPGPRSNELAAPAESPDVPVVDVVVDVAVDRTVVDVGGAVVGVASALPSARPPQPASTPPATAASQPRRVNDSRGILASHAVFRD
jgi:hypothetical protein